MFMNVHDASISIHLHHGEEIHGPFLIHFEVYYLGGVLLDPPTAKQRNRTDGRTPLGSQTLRGKPAMPSNLSNQRRVCSPRFQHMFVHVQIFSNDNQMNSSCLSCWVVPQENLKISLRETAISCNFQGEEVFQSRPGSRTPRVSCRSALKKVPRPISRENFSSWSQSVRKKRVRTAWTWKKT